MGRTLPSAMEVFDHEVAHWAKFRRALRKNEQQLFDELFLQARRHIAAMAYLANATPMESIFLAMFIEEHRNVMALGNRLRQLEEKGNGNGKGMDS